MFSATSPVRRIILESKDEPITNQQFYKIIKYFQQSHKAIVELTALVNRLPPNEALRYKNRVFTRNNINNYSRIYSNQLEIDFKAAWNNRRRRPNKKGSSEKTKIPFYISDQLREFYKNASKLGPSDPEKKNSKLSKELSLLIDEGMATSGILTSLLTNYISVNDLFVYDENGEKTGRYLPDENMKECFSDTVLTLNGKKVSKRDFREGTSLAKIEEIKAKFAEGKKSAFDRLKGLKVKNSDTLYQDKNGGLLFTTMMKLDNYFRIPDQVLTDEEKKLLMEEESIAKAAELQAKLSKLTKHRNNVKKE
jgi:hypothetical protein